jgi:hypothetical protein
MRRFLIMLFAGLLISLPLSAYALGTATLGNVEKVFVDGKAQRVIIPITFTADGAALEATYTLNPDTVVPGGLSIKGWYLLLVETDPGGTGPTNGAWDLDITNANGFLVSQNLIDDRSSTATQQVKGSTIGYATGMITNSWSITIGDNAVNNAVAVVYLTFVSN